MGRRLKCLQDLYMLLKSIFGITNKSLKKNSKKTSNKTSKKTSKNIKKTKKPIVCGNIKSRTKCLKYKRKCTFSMKTKRCKKR